MKKLLLIALLFTLFASLLADDSWFIIKPGKMVSSGGFMSMAAGSPTAMVTLGFYEDSQGNGKLEGMFVNDGYNFYPIPRELSGSDIMTEGFLTNTIFMDKENIGGIREKFEGSGLNMTLVTAFVTSNIFTMHMFNIVHVFNPKPQISGESMIYRNGTLYVGTSDGSILISSDSGKTWASHRICTSDEVTIDSIFALTDTHLFATGGASEDDVMEEKVTVKPLGGVWESTDGGKNWTALKNNMDIVPIKVVVTQTGTIFLKYMTERDLNSAQNPLPSNIGTSNDKMATFEEYFTPSLNTGKNVAGVKDMAYNNGILWLVGAAGDFAPLTAQSTDDGTTWIEYFLPHLGDGMMVQADTIHILDKKHVYAGFTNTAIAKFGDINEDYSAIPDDPPETSDDDIQILSDSDTAIAVDENENTDNETVDKESENPDTSPLSDEGCSALFI